MVLGPGPQQKKKEKEKGKGDSSRELRSGGNGSSMVTRTTRSTDIMHDEDNSEKSRDSGDGWNRRRYQREDEALWGTEGADGDSLDMSRSASGARSYYFARNPAVNDLHPPVVSTAPQHKSETRWMLQPPPSAKVMEGKERANRSRSGSGTSKASLGTKNGDPGLGRQVGERLMEEKMSRMPSAEGAVGMSKSVSRESEASSSTHLTQGQRHDRGPPSTLDAQTKHHPPRESSQRNKRPIPPPLAVSPDQNTTPRSIPLPASEDLGDGNFLDPDLPPASHPHDPVTLQSTIPLTHLNPPPRPGLPTIKSDAAESTASQTNMSAFDQNAGVSVIPGSDTSSRTPVPEEVLKEIRGSEGRLNAKLENPSKGGVSVPDS